MIPSFSTTAIHVGSCFRRSLAQKSFEAHSIWLLVNSNVDTVLVLPLITAITALVCHCTSVFSAVGGLACVAFNSLLALMLFEYGNQITGLDEDRVNRPQRPIASGRMSLHTAWQQYGTIC